MNANPFGYLPRRTGTSGAEALALLAKVIMDLDAVHVEACTWPDLAAGRLRAAREIVADVYLENSR